MTVFMEKRDVPVVSVGIAVRYGGINESVEEKGIAHFLEHMMFKGTKKRTAKQIAEAIEKRGGNVNAFTDEIITAYYCKMPSSQFDVGLDVLSDALRNSLFDSKEMEKERKVIFEEMKMRRDTPQVHVFDKIQEFLYEAPFGLDLIGTEKTMGAIDRDKLVGKFKDIYKTENLILGVVGDADFDKVCEFAEKTFEKSSGKIPEFEIKLKNQTKIEKRKGIDQANLVFAYHIPVQNEKESYAGKVLSVLMGGGMSSRLFTEIREKRNLAYDVKAESVINKKYAYSLVYAGTTKENIEKVKKLILEEYSIVAKDLNEKEMDEIKNQIIGNHQISMENSDTQLFHLLLVEVNGNAKNYYDFEKKIKEVKLEEVKRIAKFATEKNSFFALVPE